MSTATELETLRAQLAAAHVQIDDLRAQLAAAHKQLASQSEQLSLAGRKAAEGGDHAKPARRPSIDIPYWLRQANGGAAEGGQIESTHSFQGASAAGSEMVRFTVDEMPEWLKAASSSVLDLEGVEEEDELQPTSDRDDPGAAITRADVLVASFDQMPAHVTLSATIVAHALVGLHIEHEMRVELDSQAWSIFKRYSEFRALHAAVSASLGLGPFTVPKLLLHTPAALRQREQQLQELLAECISRALAARAPCAPLERFLGLEFTRVRESVAEVS